VSKKAKNHLKKDPVMAGLIAKHDVSEWYSEGDLFINLVRAIVGQQLSVKAAATIYGRVEKLLKKPISANKILKADTEKLRECGLSYSKIGFIKDLSEKVKKRELKIKELEKLSDEEVANELIKVKGIGQWTAEMFLMFSLNRPDIFSMGDLGLRNAVANLYGVDRDDIAAIEKIAIKWSPHRSMASRYLWASLDNLPDVQEK